MNKFKFTCHAVVKGELIENSVIAVSIKQAKFLFSKANGFNLRDFKIIGTEEVGPQQLSFIK